MPLSEEHYIAKLARCCFGIQYWRELTLPQVASRWGKLLTSLKNWLVHHLPCILKGEEKGSYCCSPFSIASYNLFLKGPSSSHSPPSLFFSGLQAKMRNRPNLQIIATTPILVAREKNNFLPSRFQKK